MNNQNTAGVDLDKLTIYEKCDHPECGRFCDGAGWSCRGIRDGACKAIHDQSDAIAQPRVTEQASERALIEARDRRYPIPDSPHSSVINQAHCNRTAYEYGWNDCAALTQAAPEAPAGYKLVPVTPTDAMIAAGKAEYQDAGATWFTIYRAILDAAPAAQQAGAAVEQDRRALELANAALIASEPKFQPQGWARHEAAINATGCALHKPAATTASASDGAIYEAVSRRADPEGHAEVMTKIDEVLGRAPAPSRDAAPLKQRDAHLMAVASKFDVQYDKTRGVHHYHGFIENIEALIDRGVTFAQQGASPASNAGEDTARDAARYRWLRACGPEFENLSILDARGAVIPEALDAAIDAAIAASAKEKK